MSLRSGPRAKPEPSSTDLFGWLDSLWTKKIPEGTPPTYMMHRFLASDRDLADAARELQLNVRDPKLVHRIWQGILPTGRGAPRLSYVAPKKPPQEEELIERMRQVLVESRTTVETMVEIIRESGRIAELYAEYGFKMPGEKEDKKDKPREVRKGGLLA